MGIPFLVEVSQDRFERSLAIKQETLKYLQEVDVVLPLLKAMAALPQNVEQPDLPEISVCLEWERRVEKWGLPNSGTWLDQPKWFMEDIKAAGDGLFEWQHAQTEGQDTIGLPTDIPQVGMVVQR